jgi:hypothetical protein
MLSASLDLYRDTRDALSEAAFFQTYGNMLALAQRGISRDKKRGQAPTRDPRSLPQVRDALGAIDKGGYSEALARAGYMLRRDGESLPLSRLELRGELIKDYQSLLPEIEPAEWRRIRGEQALIVQYEPEQALRTLPQLLSKPADRKRFLTLIDRLIKDERIQSAEPTRSQRTAIASMQRVLNGAVAHRSNGRNETVQARRATSGKARNRT